MTSSRQFGATEKQRSPQQAHGAHSMEPLTVQCWPYWCGEATIGANPGGPTHASSTGI